MVTVSGIFDLAASIAGDGFGHALYLVKIGFDTPKASAGKNGGFSLGGNDHQGQH